MLIPCWCWAPPLEAVDHLRCPLHCLPRPYFPSRRIVGCLLSLLVVLSTTRDCLTCWLLFVSVNADRPCLAGVDPVPLSPQRCQVNELSYPHRTAFICRRPATPLQTSKRRRSAAIPMLFDCRLLVPMLIVLTSLGLIQRHCPIDVENSANTSTGSINSSIGHRLVPIPVLALPRWRSFLVWALAKCPYQYWYCHDGVSSTGTCQVPVQVLALP